MDEAESSVLTLTSPAPGVRLLTLSLPELRNAMTEELTSAWSDAMLELRHNEDVRALVVTGEGSSFCSGADLSWLDTSATHEITPNKLRDRMVLFYETWLAPRELPFPVISAINGPAIGAGLCLALACDLRYASPTARFSAPFIFLGTHGGMASTSMLPEAVGIPRAREMLYTGREVGADEALAWGLVAGVADDVVAHSLDVAKQIASAAPIATRLTKVGLRQAHLGYQASLHWESLAQPLTMATADLHEGIQAKRQHRPPNFTGT